MQALIKYTTVIEEVIALYGSSDFSVKLMTDNPWIVGIDFDLTRYQGKPITYDSTVSQNIPAPVNQQPAPSNIYRYTVQPGQSLLDVCIQIYGSNDYMLKLITDNNLIGVSPPNLNGTVLIFDSTLIAQPSLFNKNKNKGVVYATSAVAQEVVYSNEGQTIIYTSEDGSKIYTPES